MISRLAKLFVLVQILANAACVEGDLSSPSGGDQACVDPLFDCTPPPPPPTTTEAHYRGVWSSSATDVFAVGTELELSGRFLVDRRGTILRYDGNTWFAKVIFTTERMLGVWGSSARDVFAVGGDGTILHYEGEAWGVQVSGTTVNLYGVWRGSPTDVFVVGQAGTNLHYDG